MCIFVCNVAIRHIEYVNFCVQHGNPAYRICAFLCAMLRSGIPAAHKLLPCCSPAAPIRVLYDDIHFSRCSPQPLVISLIVPPSP